MTANNIPDSDEVEITLLGRGFGESVVIHALDGDWIVIDSLKNNAGSSAPKQYLEELGVSPDQVKTIVATHWHDDHVGGMSELFQWAKSAKLALPIVKTHKELQRYIAAYQPQSSTARSSGASEIAGIIRTIVTEKRPAAVHCQADVTLLRKTSSAVGVDVLLYALAPVPEDVSHFVQRLGEAAIFGNVALRLKPFEPNDISVAAWLSFGGDAVLLGADLEVTADRRRGWHAVIASDTRPTGKAGIYKVAHHGSETGDHDDIWSELLASSPISLVSPFNRTKSGVPTKAQVDRIVKNSSSAHVTNITPYRKYKDKQSVYRATLQANRIGLRPGHSEMGRVTMRRRIAGNADWAIEYSGGAELLSRYVPRG